MSPLVSLLPPRWVMLGKQEGTGVQKRPCSRALPEQRRLSLLPERHPDLHGISYTPAQGVRVARGPLPPSSPMLRSLSRRLSALARGGCPSLWLVFCLSPQSGRYCVPSEGLPVPPRAPGVDASRWSATVSAGCWGRGSAVLPWSLLASSL